MPEGLKIGAGYITVAADLRQAKKDIKDFEKETSKQTAEIQVAANSVLASKQIAWAARSRVSLIHVQAVGLGAVEKAFARVSGVRTLTDSVTDLGEKIANLDKSVPSIAKISTALTTLSAAVLAGSSNLIVLGGSIATIAGAAFVLPGILGSIAIAGGVVAAAMEDVTRGFALKGVTQKLIKFREQISRTFWERAAQPIRDLYSSLLPKLEGSIKMVAARMGGLFGAAARAVEASDAVRVLNKMMQYLGDSIGIAKEALQPLIDAFLTLGQHGASYLPRMARWIVDISNQFNNWVQRIEKSGQLKEWTETGITALKDLGRVIGGVGGILKNLYTAAEAAGGASLGALADGLARINKVMEGPAFQGALTTVFRGAHKAMGALGVAMQPIADLFVSMAPTIARVLELGGRIAGEFLAGLAEALNRPVFKRGLTAMFEGILAGVRGLLPALPALIDVFSQFMTTVGEVARILGPLFGAAVKALAPVFIALLKAIVPVAEVLATTLANALTALAPHLTRIVNQIVQFIQKNPQLAATILAVVAGIGLLLTGVLKFLPTIIAVIKQVSAGITKFGGMKAILGKVGGAFKFLLGPIGLLVAALVTAYTQSEPFRNVMNKLIGVILKLVGTIVESMMPIFKQLMKLFMLVINKAVVPLVTALAKTLIPIIEDLMPVVKTVFEFIAKTIKNAMRVIKGIIQVVTGLISGDWKKVWRGIKNIFGGIWDQIKNILNTALKLIKQIFTAALNLLKRKWSGIWEDIKNKARSIWNKISAIITAAWNKIKTFVQDSLNKIKTKISEGFESAKRTINRIWDDIKRNISGAWNNIKNTVGNAIANVKNKIEDGFNSAKRIVDRIWTGIKNTIKNVWNNGIKPIFQAVNNFIKNTVPNAFERGVSKIRNWWNDLEGIAKKPIKFLIDTVYNDGIRGVFNKVADFAGLKKLGRLEVPGFKTGGYTGNGGTNEVAGVTHGKEYVLNAKATGDINKKHPGLLDSANKRGAAALGGGGFTPIWGPFQNAIRSTGKLFVNSGAGSAWNIPTAASMWDRLAGLRVRGGNGYPQARTGNGPLGSILAWATGAGNITFNTGGIAPGLSRAMKTATAAHEIGHVLGLPHTNGASIMQPTIGNFMQPTRLDKSRLSSLYGPGSKEPGKGGFDILGWIAEKITAPIKNLIASMINKIPGGGKMLDLAVGLGKYLFDKLKDWGMKKVMGGGEDARDKGTSTGTNKFGAMMPTLFDGGGKFEQGMLGIHRTRKPDSVLTDPQWQDMHSIAKNTETLMSSGAGRSATINNTYNVTIDARSVDSFNKVVKVFDNLHQVSRTGAGTNLRRA